MKTRQPLPIHVLICVVSLAATVRAQNINAVVNPNASVDIRNNTGGNWYFYSAPQPAPAEMFRVDSSELSAYIWGTVGTFTADTNQVYNRIYPLEYLRVLATNIPVGTNIIIPFTYKPSGPKYHFNISVVKSHQVLAISLLDPTPTAAPSVRWEVTFDTSVSGVTLSNFAFANPDGMAGMAITNISGSGSNWVVTATTGVGCGLLGLNWVGHKTESPPVPATFSGAVYDFSSTPVITVNPKSVELIPGRTTNLTVAAKSHCGGLLTYQWYSGSSAQPQNATPISGATNATYKPPTFTAAGTNSYFARVYNDNNSSDSLTATITVAGPPQITKEPTAQAISTGETATFTVTSTGTSVGYQWFRGQPGVTQNQVGSNSPSFTSGVLKTNTAFWVRVTNLLGAAYYQTSTVANATVATTLTPVVTNHATIVGRLFVNPLSAILRDSAGNPMAQQRVTFTAPDSGASGNFPGNVKVTQATTQPSSGVAEIVAFTANTNAGAFDVGVSFRSLTSSIPMLNLAANPVLKITNRANGVTMSWPVLAMGYTLQSETNLAPTGNWSDVAGSAGTNSVTLPHTNKNAAYYRLRFNPAGP